MNFIYLIYLFSGMLKSVLMYYGINLPVDLTAVLAFILILDVFWNVIGAISGKKMYLPALVALGSLLLFFLWMTIGLFYTPSETYSSQKVIYFITNILAFAYPIFHKRIKLVQFLRYFVFAVLVLSFWYMPILIYYLRHPELQGVDSPIRDVVSMYLGVGLLQGVSILLLLQNKHFFSLILRILLSVFFFACILLSGARAPAFFVFLMLIVFASIKLINYMKFGKVFYKGRLHRLILIVFITGILGIGVGLAFSSQLSVLAHRSFVRISLLFDNEYKGESVDKRVEQIDFSLEMISHSTEKFFIGYGIGSFGVLESGEDSRAYPHNFVLEILFEMGIVGLFLFLFFIFVVFVKPHLGYKKNLIPAYIFVFFLLNYAKSSSIIDMRILYAFLSLYLIQSQLKITELSENYDS
ncbi:MAG: O-antigen ligase family protein [Bacteroidota bacterium]|nr:O-antigen ligase family protein [Bacteroidota bacterium]